MSQPFGRGWAIPMPMPCSWIPQPILYRGIPQILFSKSSLLNTNTSACDSTPCMAGWYQCRCHHEYLNNFLPTLCTNDFNRVPSTSTKTLQLEIKNYVPSDSEADCIHSFICGENVFIVWIDSITSLDFFCEISVLLISRGLAMKPVWYAAPTNLNPVSLLYQSNEKSHHIIFNRRMQDF